VLCNVAGDASARDGMVTEAPGEEFWRVIRLDLFGSFLSCKHGIPELIKAGGGSVVNMTSMTALMGTTDLDCYTAAKGGVAAITRSIAAERARHPGQRHRAGPDAHAQGYSSDGPAQPAEN
jgi:NAD(P)-dependent dehydrogenase (short-subunit alcohol dehydrogenase family)